jgi:hypothetical protein
MSSSRAKLQDLKKELAAQQIHNLGAGGLCMATYRLGEVGGLAYPK